PEPEVRVSVEASAPRAVAGASVLAGPRRALRVFSDPGDKLEVKEIRFEGLEAEAADALQVRLVSTQARMELATGADDGDLRVLEVLRGLGYAQPKVLSRRLDREAGVLHLEVAPGPRKEIVQVKVAGLPAELEGEAELGPRLEVGQPAMASRIGEAGLRLERELRSRGYADAQVLPVVSEPSEHGVAVELRARPGIRQRLEAVAFSGEHHTRESFAARAAELETGALLDAGELSKARRRLLETGIFETVRQEVSADEDGSATVTFDLDERPRWSLAYGLRWESEAGIGGVVDAYDRNTMGYGVGLGVRALWLEERRSARLYSKVPGIFGTSAGLELFVEGFEEEEAEGALRTEGQTLSGQLSFPIRSDLRAQVYGRYRLVEETDLDRDFLRTRTSIPQLGFQLIWDRRDSAIDPSRGVFASLDISTSPRLGESDDDEFDRGFVRLSSYWPLFGSRLVWAQSVRAGAARVTGELPRDLRFFAGGQYSVRGYGSRSLGPRLELRGGDLRNLGGEATLVLNQELRLRLGESFETLIFLDAGEVWAEPGDARLGDLRQGIGLGLRYRSPLGLLRLDMAHPLDPREDDDDLAFYFGFGQAF
ncbi:MAG: BamA/TamA family outer membrane protein, partial [Holophagales bacterium]|nr:BamA/TamA family outer membrane protein [Holophagales bacterium]